MLLIYEINKASTFHQGLLQNYTSPEWEYVSVSGAGGGGGGNSSALYGTRKSCDYLIIPANQNRFFFKCNVIVTIW